MSLEVQITADDSEDLFKSFIHEDLLASMPIDMVEMPDYMHDPMLLDAAALFQLPDLTALSPQMTSADASFSRSLSPSSPSSAASVPSPAADWLLDFDEPLQPLHTIEVPPARPLRTDVAPCAPISKSVVKGKTRSKKVPQAPPEWKFINCSSTISPPHTSKSKAAPAKCATQREKSLECQIKIEPENLALTPKSIIPGEQTHHAPVTAPTPVSLSQSKQQAIAPAESLSPIKPTPEQLVATSLTPAQKHAERLLRNRAAALESRKRKREQQAQLEVHSAQLSTENQVLRSRISELEERNRVLETENVTLRQTIFSGFAQFEAPRLTRQLSIPSQLAGSIEVPNKKIVSTVLMTFFFSFALMLLPGFMTSTPHLGGHIVGKAYSNVSPYDEVGARLLDAPPQILYLPASSSLAIHSSESGLVPIHYSPASRRVESSLSIPLDRHFTNTLGSISRQVASSNLPGGAQLANLHALFVEPTGTSSRQSMPRRNEHSRNSGDGKRKSSQHHRQDLQNDDHIRVPPDHGVRYESDGSGAEAIPRVSISDVIHLLPFRAIHPSSRKDSTVGGGGPKVSLIATIPSNANSAQGHAEDGGSFLQLDLEVIDARMVRWNLSEKDEDSLA
ncbi:hypothetical protein HKX48_007488 [Thoreauomyces humboldtii]|nr:hypothetical protein HKX48_007488 [Thoreauomyces humboldtii]